jgi:membrane protein
MLIESTSSIGPCADAGQPVPSVGKSGPEQAIGVDVPELSSTWAYSRASRMIGKIARLIKESVAAFIDDGALSHGAAIAYYTIFAIAPVLLIAIAIAGLAFGQAAAQGAIVDELSGLMGQQSAEALQNMLQSASNGRSGTIATIVGLITLLLTASGVFVEMQTSLNAIWKAEPNNSTVSRLIRARLVSLGLILALGFLLMVSLAASAALAALGSYLNGILPAIRLLLYIGNFIVSFVLVALLFAAIYKFLPDTQIAWRDVAMGAVVTTLLFTVGKWLIGLYIGSSQVASTYGAAGALIVILLWIYYSAEIFLLGAEFTKCYARRHGSRAWHGMPAPIEDARGAEPTGRPAKDARFFVTLVRGLVLFSVLAREIRRR